MKGYALVTGASGFLGKEIAYELSKRNYNLILHYKDNYEIINDLISKIKSLGNSNMSIVTVKADFSTKSGINKLIKLAKKYQVQALINSASIYSEKKFEDISFEDWEKILRVNLISMFFLSRELGLIMKLNRKRGVIINISCLTGIYGFNVYQCIKPSLPYIISKIGVITLTKYLAQELGPYVKVISVAPGWINKPEIENPKISKCIKENIALGRAANVNEISKLIADLVEGKVNYVNGSVIELSGGLRFF